MIAALLAASEISKSDLNLIVLILAILVLCGAAYVGGFLRNIPGAAVMILVGVILLVFAL